jgi:hypothetical protein
MNQMTQLPASSEVKHVYLRLLALAATSQQGLYYLDIISLELYKALLHDYHWKTTGHTTIPVQRYTTITPYTHRCKQARAGNAIPETLSHNLSHIPMERSFEKYHSLPMVTGKRRKRP